MKPLKLLGDGSSSGWRGGFEEASSTVQLLPPIYNNDIMFFFVENKVFPGDGF